VEVNPQYVVPHSNLCYVLWHQARYELAHSINPAPSTEAAIEGCEAALRINPSHADAYDNMALVHIVRAEHAILTGADPAASLTLAKEAASTAVRLSPTRVELQHNLVTAHSLDAVHTLHSRRDPTPPLAKGNAVLSDIRKLAPQNALSEMLQGKLDLIAARAAIVSGKDPEPHIEAARAALDKAAALNPRDAEIFHVAAQLFRHAAEHRAGKQEKQALDFINQGLENADKSLSLNPGLPAVIATKGALHLLRAHVAPKPADRAEAARLAEAALAEALRANPFLKREFGPLLEEAQSIAKKTDPKGP
jgi:tetratricopeptide (TPR) repeat protein